MKILFEIILLLIILPSVHALPTGADSSFLFEGEIRGYGTGEIIMTYSNPNEKMKPDTIAIKDDKFTFKGTVEAPLLAFTKIMNNGKLERDFFRFDFMLENSVIKFSADVNELNKYDLKGSASNDMMRNIKKWNGNLIRDYLNAEKAYRAAPKDSEEQAKLKEEMDERLNTYLDYFLNIDGVFQSYAGIYWLQLFSGKKMQWQRLDSILALFDEPIHKSVYYTYLQRTVDAKKRIQPGQPAADFVVKDLDGREYSLNSFKGHYLLMTFSASWCGPCKYEYPFLVKAYEKFADQGLEVIIMNVDDSREKWAGDVEKYKFPFPVLSDLKAFTGDLTKNYGAMSIPKIFLIDPDGGIVSSTIRQQGILDELAKIYKVN